MPTKSHPNPIWNDEALGFFEDGRPQQEQQQQQQQQYEKRYEVSSTSRLY